MPYIDPDNSNPRLVAELVRRYEESAATLKDLVLNPKGRSPEAQAFNRARAATTLGQVQAEIDRLKKSATNWTGTALDRAIDRGKAVADEQLAQIPDSFLQVKRSNFAGLDRRAVEVLAKDTVGDLIKAADSMGNQAKTSLKHMAATGVTNAEVNQILTRGVISGNPDAAIRELKDALKKVHGKTVMITDKNGDPMNFDVGTYAKLVANTKTREAVCQARHDRLQERGIDLVRVVGRVSKTFCTFYLGKVFSISGTSTKYPPLSGLPSGGPPFHPNCSKSTAPFIEKLASAAALKEADPNNPQFQGVLQTKNTTALQKEFTNSNARNAAEQRQKNLVNDIRARAKAAGYDPPAYGAAGSTETPPAPKPVRSSGTRKPDRTITANDAPVTVGIATPEGKVLTRIDVADQTAAELSASGVRAAASALGDRFPAMVKDAPERFTGEDRLRSPAAYSQKTGEILINPNAEMWQDPKGRMAKAFSEGVASSDRPDHAVIHEVGHWAHLQGLSPQRRQEMRQPFDQATRQQVAKEVSLYAASKKEEFVAEVFAGRVAGRKFSAEIMKLYREFGGP